MNSVGPTSPRRGWVRRASASNPAMWPSAIETIGWLVDLERVVGDHLAQVGFQLQVGFGASPHLRVEDLAAGSAALGALQRDGRVAQDLVRPLVAARADRDAGAGGGEDLTAVHVEGPLQRGAQAFRDARGVARVRHVLEQDRELVAGHPPQGEPVAGAGERVARLQRRLQPARDLDEQPIRGRGAETGIQRLEAVEPERGSAKRSIGCRSVRLIAPESSRSVNRMRFGRPVSGSATRRW